MKYNRNTQNLLRYCLLTAVLLLYQIVSLCAAETALNTAIERNSSPSTSLLPPPDTTIYVDICDGVPYHFHGHTYESDSTETITLAGQASDGGDSIINLIVTEHHSPTINITANPTNPICEGESITLIAECDCEQGIFNEGFTSLQLCCLTTCNECDYNSYPPLDYGNNCDLSLPANFSRLPQFPASTRFNTYPVSGGDIRLGKGPWTTPEACIGSITSIPLDLSKPFKITITAKGWGDEPGKITVCVDGIPQQSINTIHNGWGSSWPPETTYTLYFPAATNSSTITIKTDTIIKPNGVVTGYRAFIGWIEIKSLCHHYSWSTGIADSNAIITVQPEHNESYSVTVTNDNNCSASASYSVIVNHPQGTSETISACNNSYIWHNSTYTQSGTYYYTYPTPDLYGCIPVDTLHLMIHDNIPNAHISGNLNISGGQSTSLTVTPTGDQPYTYTWSASWSSGTSLFPPNTTNVFNTGVLHETTRYIVTVTDTNGCQSNDTATVYVSLCENWQLVTDESELAVGDRIVITNSDASYVLSTTQQANNRLAMPITHSGNTLFINENAQIITLEQGTVDNTFALHVNNGYLYAASSETNFLRTQIPNNDNGSWTISISGNGTATIIAQGNNTHRNLRFHIPQNPGPTNPDSIYLFSCYRNGQQDVAIYKRTILRSETDTFVTSCSTYHWIDKFYTESGTYIDTLTNSMGCDSIITLHLTVLHEDAATVTFNPGNGTCDTNTLTEVDCQAGITLPTATSCAENYTFAGWTTTSINAPTSIIPTPLYEAGEHYNPSTDLTLYAVYIKCESEPEVKYKKVTSTPPNWNGDYLIVCEEKNVAFNGGLGTLDAVGNTITVTISGNTIESNNSTDAAKFTIAAFNGDYSILSASGKFIGNPSNTNSLATQNTASPNSINLDNDGNINIIGSGGAYLRYNANSDQTRFRYFKSSTYTSQKAIQLYRKEELYNNCEYTSYTPVDTIDMDTTVYICHYNCTGNDEAFCNLIFEDGLYDRSWRWRIWTEIFIIVSDAVN